MEVPLESMQVQMVGMVGYEVMDEIAFLVLGRVLGSGERSPSIALAEASAIGS